MECKGGLGYPEILTRMHNTIFHILQFIRSLSLDLYLKYSLARAFSSDTSFELADLTPSLAPFKAIIF